MRLSLPAPHIKAENFIFDHDIKIKKFINEALPTSATRKLQKRKNERE